MFVVMNENESFCCGRVPAVLAGRNEQLETLSPTWTSKHRSEEARCEVEVWMEKW